MPEILTQLCMFLRTSIRPIKLDDPYPMLTRKTLVFADDRLSLPSHAPLYPGMMGDKRAVVLVDIYLVFEQDQEHSRTDVRLGAYWLQGRGKCRDVRQWPSERRRGAACAIIFHFLKIL
jgi:hypothetical protein